MAGGCWLVSLFLCARCTLLSPVKKPIFQDRICAVVAASTAKEAISKLRAAVRRTHTVEIRLDWLGNRREIAKLFESGVRLPAGTTLIATCRNARAGGRFRGSIEQQFFELFAAVMAGFQWRDIEIEVAGKRSLPVYEPGSRGNSCDAIIVSSHDFQECPQELPIVLRNLLARKGQAAKIAAQCESLRDALRVLELCKGRRDVIAVPMGEIGLPARVLALAHGSALAYAAVGEKTAPGQLTLDEMKNLYRADKLNKKSRVYGVIGNPVSHSLSPLLHNTGFIARRKNDVYLPFLVKDLRDFLAAVKPLNIRGFSVTIPFKEKMLRYLDDCDPLAAQIGAVNTVIVRGNGKLYGMNTDYVGVLRALQKRVRLRGSRVLIYGAGGVARAVAFALAHEGAIPAICARRPEQARKLARAVHGEAVERRHLRREFFDAIVNCTPVGMHPNASQSPLRGNELNCRLVFDTVYRPQRTKLLQLAERRGIETVSGAEMFIAQGIAQWEIWTEQRAPEKQMRAAVLRKLVQEEKKR